MKSGLLFLKLGWKVLKTQSALTMLSLAPGQRENQEKQISDA